jgi:hypothetical protein
VQEPGCGQKPHAKAAKGATEMNRIASDFEDDDEDDLAVHDPHARFDD